LPESESQFNVACLPQPGSGSDAFNHHNSVALPFAQIGKARPKHCFPDSHLLFESIAKQVSPGPVPVASG
jgi:hypothetical protein